jgi:eukaryotic-like serine/threonine-protein kinase
MTNDPAAVLGQQALKLGLLTEEQVRFGLDEAGDADPEAFLLALERKRFLTPWQSGKLLKGDTDGYFLGGYRLLYKIASGSFGRVFRAEEPGSGRVVAIKILRRRWSEDPQRIELFDREGRVGLSLRHPNIVEILAVNRDASSGQYYIVMEFVEGGNLRELLGIRKKLEPAEALKIIEDAAAGLVYAATRNICHRDIKLTNILISSTRQAKLVDFGLAQIVYSGGRLKEEEKVERTCDYAGLERATNVKSGDVRSDIFFLGCVLYEVLTGRSPILMTRDRQARMQKQRFDNIMPMRPDEVNAPPSVFRLVETMMSLAPQHRYQTPAQLLDAVRAARRDLEGKPGERNHTGPRSVFVAENDDRLQEALRDKFKQLGYRVFLAADPVRALDRFRQQPFDALIVDAGTIGEDGLLVFERVMSEAARQGLSCAGLLILNGEQSDWTKRVQSRPDVSVFVRPVTLKQLHHRLQELVPTEPPKKG